MRIILYQEKYLQGCITLIATTWNLDECLENPKGAYIYEYFIRRCAVWSDFLEIIVDENDNVQGILFGRTCEVWKSRFLFFKLSCWLLWHIFNYDLGEIKGALRAYHILQTQDKDAQRYAQNCDGEVNLLIISPILRGLGYGSKLMNRFVEVCKEKERKKLFLWTTTECSFGFYDSYGFRTLGYFKMPYEGEEMGIAYCLELDSCKSS